VHIYYDQVHEFCGLMIAAVRQAGTPPPAGPLAGERVSAFAEKLVACPTVEAARACIATDLDGALGFARAVDGLNRLIQAGSYVLPVLRSAHQPRFFVLGCAVQDYLAAAAT